MSVSLVSYFGYGSLVNRDTRPPDEIAVNATLNGWRRVWDHRVLTTAERHACTSLSIERADDAIDGVLVQIPESRLPELDARESGYRRLPLNASNFTHPPGVSDTIIYVYQSLESNRHLADDEHPVTRSYIDCVMAGYARRFGDTGLRHLLQTTRGWDRPVLEDRAAPTYPRSVRLPEEQLNYFDSLLAPFRDNHFG